MAVRVLSGPGASGAQLEQDATTDEEDGQQLLMNRGHVTVRSSSSSSSSPSSVVLVLGPWQARALLALLVLLLAAVATQQIRSANSSSSSSSQSMTTATRLARDVAAAVVAALPPPPPPPPAPVVCPTVPAAAAPAAAVGVASSSSVHAALLDLHARVSDTFSGDDGDDAVLALYHRLHPDPAGMVLVDVGANKGIYTLELLVQWCDGLSRIGATLIPETLSTSGVGDACPLVVHLLEPVPNNFRLLKQLLQERLANVGATLHFHPLALSDQSGALTFYTMKSGGGDEQASLNPALAIDREFEALPPVTVLTLDDFFEQNKLTHVHLLKLDGEGYDPQMIYGGSRVLGEHRVDVLQFEYNDKWRSVTGWDPTRQTLKTVAEHLEKLGYDTFLVGRRNLYQLSRGLWHDRLEIWYWSNCFAFSRKLDATIRQKIVSGYNLDFPTLEPIGMEVEP